MKFALNNNYYYTTDRIVYRRQYLKIYTQFILDGFTFDVFFLFP